jgi:hypothetical protein
VTASALAVSFVAKGGRDRTSRVKRAQERPEDFVRSRAKTYTQDIMHTKEAYEAHEGAKVLVRYEDLRANTLDTMKQIYSTLQIAVEEEDLARVIEKHSFENVPEEKKGAGTIRRKATPKGWMEDLTPEQIRIIEEEAAPILDQFYAGDRYLVPE